MHKSQVKKKPEDIDVFWYLEEVMLKKDLDTDDWYRERTKKMVLNNALNLKNDVVGFIEVGEKIPKRVAEKSFNLFVKDLEKEIKTTKDRPYDVTQGEY